MSDLPAERALTPEQAEALTHWSTHGRTGLTVAERYIPDTDECASLRDFVRPESGDWPDVFDEAQTGALLNGFPCGEMEDKWIIYSDDISDAATTSVHFHRSWTGQEIIRVDLHLSATGSTLTRATWEKDAATLKNRGETFARDTFVKCCGGFWGCCPASS
ncbi:hypothetical protein BH11ACT4_BH11ACT4_13750 [soil metagenome]